MQNIREISESTAWIDTTLISSPYETQLNHRNGQERYRLHGTEEWHYGVPPKGKSNG